VVNEEGRGLKSPLFLYFILRFNMDQKAVKDIVDLALALNESLYLIELSISVNNKVQVVVDGDNGVSLSECIRISKVINDNFDREVEDFSLEVTTPDISHPLKEKIEGTLVTADEDKIVLQWKAREPKPVGKGNVTVEKTVTLEYIEIKEAKVKILF
jgi:ribosome maturation factor RimP